MRSHLPVNNSVPVEKVIPETMEQLFLPLYLKHPAPLKLRDAGIFMAGISEASPGFRLRRTPDFLFAVFTRSGSGRIIIDGEPYLLEPGSLFLAPAHREQLYFQVGSAIWRFLWFHLKVDTPLLRPTPSEPAAGSPFRKRLPQCTEAIAKIRHFIEKSTAPPVWQIISTRTMRSGHPAGVPSAASRKRRSERTLYCAAIPFSARPSKQDPLTAEERRLPLPRKTSLYSPVLVCGTIRLRHRTPSDKP